MTVVEGSGPPMPGDVAATAPAMSAASDAELALLVARRAVELAVRSGRAVARRLPGATRRMASGGAHATGWVVGRRGPMAAGNGRSLWSSRSRWSVASLHSHSSALSAWSLGSAGSVASVGSLGSVLSIGSTGSILSIGSVGSILSIGSAGGVLSIGAHPWKGDETPALVEALQPLRSPSDVNRTLPG